ncbi:MAG TPA: UDP-N-acetylmuramoyl-L-alanine--D-glutamate ligase [Candidatus Limnocylindrales bacterium]|nr:UDP-N-acetylmuramoyl-L-alanine--D-glutamate ligase [Candidatus Limnocylindrales bacterium]
MTDGPAARVIDPDGLTHAGLLEGAFRGRPVTVLGFARSGIAAARFLADAGARVTVYDGRPAAELRAAIAALEGRHVTLRLGPDVDPATTWRHAALVVTSPSINPDYPTTEPRLRAQLTGLVAARATGDAAAPALVSEPELFLRLCPAPTVGVTGTKGKTTTSALTAALLAADPSHPAILGGNIGIPLVERLPELTPGHRVVVELSELQLPTLSRGTTVAVYTNVTADHLDRHGSLEAYRRVKRRLAELVDPDGALVLNGEDPVVAAYAGLGTAPALLYRVDRPIPGGVGVVDGWIVGAGVQRLPLAGGGPAAVGPGGRILPVDELAIPGRHNVANALAAVGTALLFGVAPDAIRRAAAAFTGVEHRLETVAVAGGVRYVNDSQGTQPDAVIAALRSFEPPVVLIAGGRDKGVDLSDLAEVVAERAAAAVLIGESADAMAGLFRGAGLARIERAATLDDAVATATALAREELAARGEAGTGPTGPTATVLLSPAAASFDMFVDYAARGRAFKAAVARLAARDAAGGPAGDGIGDPSGDAADGPAGGATGVRSGPGTNR